MSDEQEEQPASVPEKDQEQNIVCGIEWPELDEVGFNAYDSGEGRPKP
jgi:hypothetical protein